MARERDSPKDMGLMFPDLIKFLEDCKRIGSHRDNKACQLLWLYSQGLQSDRLR